MFNTTVTVASTPSGMHLQTVDRLGPKTTYSYYKSYHSTNNLPRSEFFGCHFESANGLKKIVTVLSSNSEQFSTYYHVPVKHI